MLSGKKLLHLSAIFEKQNSRKLRNFSFQVFLILLLATLNSKAQTQDTVKVISFRVVNAVTNSPVELAHIINLTRSEDAIADLLGYFKIPILLGDTISITSLGYYYQTLINEGQFGNDSTFYTIKLTPRFYLLKEIKVSWFSTYDKFLKGFLELQLPVSKEEKETIRITEYFDRTIRKLSLVNMPKSSSGMGFGKDWLAKQNEKLDERLEKERIRRVIEKKYSAGIVSDITGLTGNEVHLFMAYCAFNDEELVKLSDYDIRTKILGKFKIYNIDKTSKEKK